MYVGCVKIVYRLCVWSVYELCKASAPLPRVERAGGVPGGGGGGYHGGGVGGRGTGPYIRYPK